MCREAEETRLATSRRKWAAFDRAFAARYDKDSARTQEEEAAAEAAYKAAVAEYWAAENEAALYRAIVPEQ